MSLWDSPRKFIPNFESGQMSLKSICKLQSCITTSTITKTATVTLFSGFKFKWESSWGCGRRRGSPPTELPVWEHGRERYWAGRMKVRLSHSVFAVRDRNVCACVRVSVCYISVCVHFTLYLCYGCVPVFLLIQACVCVWLHTFVELKVESHQCTMQQEQWELWH